MHSIRPLHRSFWVATLMTAVACLGLPVRATVFNNFVPINTPAQGVASPYGSQIFVSGMSGNISSLTVSLNNVNHARPDDLEILLVSPAGQKFILISDAGGTTVPVSGATITFSDAAANLIPNAGPLTAGSWKPTCVNAQGDIQDANHFPSPAPASPYALPATSAVGGTGGGTATLNGTFGGFSPNGIWNLYVIDDFTGVAGESGAITGGWSLDITASVTTQSTTTTVNSSANPSFTGSSVAFTATVTSSGSPAGAGSSVTFLDGAVTLGTATLSASGIASLSTAGLSEGTHTITASYGGAVGFAASQGSMSQRVDTATAVTGSQFCNPGGLNLSSTSPGTASAYPSRLFVSGLSGSISKISLKLNGITIDRPDDLEFLLVGPGGQSLVFLGDSGGIAAAAGVNLVFEDSAASLVPDSGPLISGTFRPTSVNSSATSFPSPAPAGPYSQAAPGGSSTFASIFNGASPNGTWSLYGLDDVVGAGGTVTSWCLTFTTTGDVATTTTVSSSPNPSTVGQSVTLSATVKRADNNAAVAAGAVSFREGNTTLAANVPVDGSGVATFATTALTAGTHVISADFGGVAGSFNTSTGSSTHQVDTATVVSGNQFCNPGTITVVQELPLTGDVYPSRILVQNAGGTVTKVTVALNGISTDRPDDFDVLLVGPGGEKLVLVADAGGINSVAGINLVLDDAAANSLADAGPLTSGTFRPSAFLSASFPAPAPGSPNFPAPLGGATLGSVFNGISPNGYWSLYVVDDVDSAQASVISGWCLTLETTPAITCPAPITVNVAAGSCNSAPVSFAATATGLPSPTITYTWNGNPITSPHAFPVGVNVVTASTSGMDTCTFSVTVVDNILPTITCPKNVVAHIAAGAASGIVNYPPPLAVDNCSAVVTSVPASGSSFPLGQTTVTCTATDPTGNSDTCTFTVTVNRQPSPNPDTLGTTEGVPVSAPIAKLLANDTDPEGQTLSMVSVQNPSAAGVPVSIVGPNVVYAPPTGLVGTDSFQYTVRDTLGGQASTTVFVAIRSKDAISGNSVSVTLTPNSRIVRFAGIPGIAYIIQFAQSVNGPWTNLSPPIVATATGVIEFTDTENPPPAERYYRTVLAPAP